MTDQDQSPSDDAHEQRQANHQAVEPRLQQELEQVGSDDPRPADDEEGQREHRRVHSSHRLKEGFLPARSGGYW